MEEEVLRKYIEAGRIAARVLREAASRIEAGARVLDVCEYAERRIRELGGEPAFPCNLSINEEAAHYSPLIGDEKRIPECAVVKLDIGVHIDGYIADTALTVDLCDRYTRLLEAVREALEKALSRVAAGVPFREIGRVVENTLVAYGYKPIRNLTGHSLGRYLVHAGDTIPNIDEPIGGSFQAGRAYAIEPFGTDGAGYVREGEAVTIYSLNPERPSIRAARLRAEERRLLAEIASRFKTLPFTERWLDPGKYGGVDQLRLRLRRLWRSRMLIAYPVLIEAGGGMVAQFEHTVVVLKDRVIVTTMPEGEG